jgi:hypothetical protein
MLAPPAARAQTSAETAPLNHLTPEDGTAAAL